MAITAADLRSTGMPVNPTLPKTSGTGGLLGGVAQTLPNTGTQTVGTAALPKSATKVNTAQANIPGMPAAATYDPRQIAINEPTETVQGQIQGIINANSPLMQQAETRAKQSMAPRGLLNSSMAVGAAQGAVLDAAMPIAQTDAGAYRAADLANADMANQANQFGAQQTNAMATAGTQLATDTAKFNAQQQNQAIINQLDAANKIQLADIQATYQNEMQANSSASQLFNQTMAAISNIQQSTTMDAATKKASTDQMISLLKSGMTLQGSIANLNLSGVLNFKV
jgi:hypothetical protein